MGAGRGGAESNRRKEEGKGGDRLGDVVGRLVRE